MSARIDFTREGEMTAEVLEISSGPYVFGYVGDLEVCLTLDQADQLARAMFRYDLAKGREEMADG